MPLDLIPQNQITSKNNAFKPKLPVVKISTSPSKKELNGSEEQFSFSPEVLPYSRWLDVKRRLARRGARIVPARARAGARRASLAGEHEGQQAVRRDIRPAEEARAPPRDDGAPQHEERRHAGQWLRLRDEKNQCEWR